MNKPAPEWIAPDTLLPRVRAAVGLQTAAVQHRPWKIREILVTTLLCALMAAGLAMALLHPASPFISAKTLFAYAAFLSAIPDALLSAAGAAATVLQQIKWLQLSVILYGALLSMAAAAGLTGLAFLIKNDLRHQEARS